MKKSLAAVGILAASALATPAMAADYSEGLHKNDYKWAQFNLMYALEQLPRGTNGASGHDYLEMEFGGKSGIFDLYGYVDIFNLTENKNQDTYGGSKIFMKLAPRVSIDAVTGKDLSFGPVKEIYFSTLFNWGGGSNDVYGVPEANPNNSFYAAGDSADANSTFWGIGADVEVPWLGKTGMNLYGFYDMKPNAKKWNGYQFSMNWFKPFYFLDNGSFVSYQGYVDYQFGADKGPVNTTKGGATFHGIYWHSDRYSAGYGLKAYKDVYLLKSNAIDLGDAGKLDTTGFSHYFAATYKF